MTACVADARLSVQQLLGFFSGCCAWELIGDFFQSLSCGTGIAYQEFLGELQFLGGRLFRIALPPLFPLPNGFGNFCGRGVVVRPKVRAFRQLDERELGVLRNQIFRITEQVDQARHQSQLFLADNDDRRPSLFGIVARHCGDDQVRR